MEVKIIEIRDAGTFIPAMAIRLSARDEAETYLLRRAGYSKEAITNTTTGISLVCPKCRYIIAADIADDLVKDNPEILCPNHLSQRTPMSKVTGPMSYDGEPYVILCKLDGVEAQYDPYSWPSRARTMPVAHRHLIERWAHVQPGQVIDVEFILGESQAPKVSERVSAGLIYDAYEKD